MQGVDLRLHFHKLSVGVSTENRLRSLVGIRFAGDSAKRLGKCPDHGERPEDAECSDAKPTGDIDRRSLRMVSFCRNLARQLSQGDHNDHHGRQQDAEYNKGEDVKDVDWFSPDEREMLSRGVQATACIGSYLAIYTLIDGRIYCE